MGNPGRSAVEGNALNCGLMLTCGAAHRPSVYDLLASFTISCCQKMLKRAPEGMRFNPPGLRRLCCYFLLTRPTWNVPYRLVPVLVNQQMRARPARLHAAEGCAKARLFSRGMTGARNSHFPSNHCRVTTDAAV